MSRFTASPRPNAHSVDEYPDSRLFEELVELGGNDKIQNSEIEHLCTRLDTVEARLAALPAMSADGAAWADAQALKAAGKKSELKIVATQMRTMLLTMPAAWVQMICAAVIAGAVSPFVLEFFKAHFP